MKNRTEQNRTEQNRTEQNKLEYVQFSQNRSSKEAKNIYDQRIKDAINIFQKHNHSFSIRNCPFCDSSSFRNAEKFHECYGVSICNRCSSYFVNPVPSMESLSDYYNNSQCNILLDNLVKKRKAKSADFIIDDRVAKVIDYIASKTNSNQGKIRILEVGCGSGSFLSKLKASIEHLYTNKYNLDYCGIDIDKNAIDSKVNDELNLVCSSVEDYINRDGNSYDIILHFELIEHLIDPSQFMMDSKKLLRENGIMIFTTQNHNGLEMVASDYNSYRLLAHSIFPPMHLNAFSTTNISYFAMKCGFNVLEVSTPGKLDVDMVTETKEYIEDIGFKALASVDNNTKGLIQYLIAKLKVSSHMQCVLQVSNIA